MKEEKEKFKKELQRKEKKDKKCMLSWKKAEEKDLNNLMLKDKKGLKKRRVVNKDKKKSKVNKEINNKVLKVKMSSQDPEED